MPELFLKRQYFTDWRILNLILRASCLWIYSQDNFNQLKGSLKTQCFRLGFNFYFFYRLSMFLIFLLFGGFNKNMFFSV